MDDSGYLWDLVDEIKRQLTIDDRRVYAVGHSNGGFMSYRLACDHADVFAAIASLAGGTYKDENLCGPSEPVHVLQIHGTADGTIRYDGGNIGGVAYPGARESVQTWTQYDLCAAQSDTGFPGLNLDRGISGRESVVEKWVRNAGSSQARRMGR